MAATVKRILILDDDEIHLENLAAALTSWGYSTVSCLNVAQACRQLNPPPDLAIVDLFLEGNEGEELSNGFVADFLIKADIPYLRMSSAPGLVPEEFSGLGVYDKRKFRNTPDGFRDFLKEIFGSNS